MRKKSGYNLKSPGKGKRNKSKSEILFDLNSRNDYVSGFHKRKVERREKAKEKIEKRTKDEKRATKKEALDDVKKRYQEVVDYRKALISHFEKKEKEPKKPTQDSKTETEIFNTASDKDNFDQDNSDKESDQEKNQILVDTKESNTRQLSSEFYRTPGSVTIKNSTLDWGFMLPQQNLALELDISARSTQKSEEIDKARLNKKKSMPIKKKFNSNKRKLQHGAPKKQFTSKKIDRSDLLNRSKRCSRSSNKKPHSKR